MARPIQDTEGMNSVGMDLEGENKAHAVITDLPNSGTPKENTVSHSRDMFSQLGESSAVGIDTYWTQGSPYAVPRRTR